MPVLRNGAWVTIARKQPHLMKAAAHSKTHDDVTSSNSIA
jgi:hypothetical protein